MKTQTPISVLPNTKPHYEILDGLRGVAAIMVVSTYSKHTQPVI